MPALELIGMSKSQADGKPLLDGVNLSIDPGETVALVGRSGSGKSTLLSVLGLLDMSYAGTYLVDGVDVSTLTERSRSRYRAQKVGFVFQNFALIKHLNVRQNIAVALDNLPRRSQGEVLGASNIRSRVDVLLALLGIEHLASRHPNALSGGEQQRVAIARALVCRPSIILADEPTGSLDIETGEVVMGELLRVAHEEAAALLVVTHDPAVAKRADRTLAISDRTLTDAELAASGTAR